MRTFLRLLLVLGLAAAVVVGLRMTVFAAKPVPVTVFRVAPGLVEATVTNSKAGTVKSRRRAGLSPQIGGRVVELPARRGDRVRKGDPVLRLWDDDLRAQVRLQEDGVRAVEAAREEACLAAEQAEREARRMERLFREEVVSKDLAEKAASARDTRRAGCTAAAARIDESRAALARARTELSKTVVRAPFDGIVAELRTELGEYATPGAPGVFIPSIIDLIDPDAIYVSAPLDEVDSGKVRVGQPVRLSFDPHPDQGFSGRVVRVAPYVEDSQDQNRTFEVEIDLDDVSFARSLAPGMTADVEIVLETRQDVLRVPSYALLQGRKVLVVRGETLVEVPVETGLRNWQFAELLSGLSRGELVVVSLDRAEVVAGAKVRVASETEK